MTDPDLPAEADAFLTRLVGLPEPVWQELLDRSKPRLRDWLLGLWIGLTSPFRRRQFAAVDIQYSEVAAHRVDDLLRRRAVPQHLSWRIKPIVHLAVQAICSQATLTPRQLAGVYAPFEPYIPRASLTSGSSKHSERGGA